MNGPVLIGLSYLLGSVSASYWAVRWLRHEDIRTVGSQSAGATNTLRRAGVAAGLAVLAFDALKGAVPVALGQRGGFGEVWVAGAALTVVVGHVLPVFHGFRGGKGVATAAGAFGVLLPAHALAAIAVFVVTLAWKRYVSLASVAAAVALPTLVAFDLVRGWSGEATASGLLATGGVMMIVLAKHQSNLARLRAGEEPRLGRGGSSARQEAGE